MCRNIKLLLNFDPPSTHDEIRDSAIQYVRKVSGMRAPSRLNEESFNRAIEEITASVEKMFGQLTVNGPPHTRDAEREKAVERGRKREEQFRARAVAFVASRAPRGR